MPWTEILKVKPQLDGSALNDMDRNLGARFTKIAKKFGSGLLSAIKGGGVVALGTALVDKLLNPLKDVQESIEKALSQSGDLATFAKQFQTTPGNLARLQAFGQAKGLDAEGVRLLLGKFQNAIATSAADPTQRTAVSNYIGKKDTAEAFFEFIQALQKLTPIQQNLVQQEVFGDKQILRASEFLHANFAELNLKVPGPKPQQIDEAVKFGDSLNDQLQTARAARDYQDIVTKAKNIGNNAPVDLLLAREQLALKQENKNLASIDKLEKIQIAADRMANTLQDAYLKLAPALAIYLPSLVSTIAESAKSVEKSRAVRGVGGAGKGKGE